MTYTYGTHGAPAVGGGLPGLPQRSGENSGAGRYTRSNVPPGYMLLDGVTPLSKASIDAGLVVPAYSAYQAPAYLSRAASGKHCVEFYEDDAYMVQIENYGGSQSVPGLRIYNTKDPENVVQVPYADTPKLTAPPVDLSLNPNGVGICVCEGAYAPVLVFLRVGDTFTTISTARPAQLAGQFITMVALSPDGNWAVFAARDSVQMFIYSLDASGALSYVQTISRAQTYCCGVWWLYDGSLMVAQGANELVYALYRYRLDSGGGQFGVGSPMGASIGRGLHSDNQYHRAGLTKDRKRFAHIVSSAAPFDIRVLEIGDSAVTTVATFATGGSSVSPLAVFSADGRFITSPQWYGVGDGTAVVRTLVTYELATGAGLAGRIALPAPSIANAAAACGLFASTSRRLLSFQGYNESLFYYARNPEVGYGGGLYAAIRE